ncbi:C4-dicarboxylate TRAP transporter large permease protein DctM [invertebrate metagenome]|uniref:C4-dicarboxylate TRAP transporter large permease protein DctM n=1 Tax=invertebrate metagenome TaxID=1711999 RepID=A0A2H9T9N4_9ZZZZ
MTTLTKESTRHFNESPAALLSSSPDKPCILLLAFLWSLFQLWYSSPLPYLIGTGLFNDSEARAIHLGFAMALAFLLHPNLRKKKATLLNQPHWVHYFFSLLSGISTGYLYLFYQSLAERSGAPTLPDLITAGMGVILLLEATRRVLGSALVVVASLFLFYAFAGPWMPDIIAHKGASLNKALSHFWITSEGVFGVALGVSTQFVFLFVLFGALLERAGAGHYFIQVAISLLGHFRGGPAKAAILSSGLSGMVSGSSIANVVTTGTFTIPLMKRTGFSPEKAGAIEVAASTNGQLTPPVMGAAAFLMVEYTGISYLDVIRHALLPAAISYIALFYIVHLEAIKSGITGLPRTKKSTVLQSLLSATGSFTGLCLLGLVVYYGMSGLQVLAGNYANIISGIILALVYILLLYVASQQPDSSIQTEQETLPSASTVIKSGLYFLLPLVVLLWCLMVERLSPGLSAFWATGIMMIITITHKPLLHLIKKTDSTPTRLLFHFQSGCTDLFHGITQGALNMTGIAIATAAAGIVVGTVTLTGIGLVMTEMVEWLSGGNILLMLILTAFICLILGMGLPTTANYIVVSTLMAPVIVTIGAENGLAVPLIAVHLFVFYFGILADDTPPVGLAAFAASGIAGSDPLKTGLQGFAYDIRTAILPFLFIFNTELLLIGIHHWMDLMLVVTGATLAMLVFASATQQFFITRNRWYETAALLLAAFILFRPDFFWDKWFPPYQIINPPGILSHLEQLPPNQSTTLKILSTDFQGNTSTKWLFLPEEDHLNGHQRLFSQGITLQQDNSSLNIQHVIYNSPAYRMGVRYNNRLEQLKIPVPQPPKQLIWIFALILIVGIYCNQKKRSQRQASSRKRSPKRRLLG